MRQMLQRQAQEASNTDGRNAVAKTTDGKSAGDENWFAEAARNVHPNKAGTALYYATGLGDERACQRYAAGSVKPSANFLRRLLRTEEGWQWLCETMVGSNEKWWLEVQLAYAVERARKELIERGKGNGNFTLDTGNGRGAD